MPHKPMHQNYYLNPTHSSRGDNQKFFMGGIGKYATMTYLYEGKLQSYGLIVKAGVGGQGSTPFAPLA